MKYFFVNQGKRGKSEFEGGFLWTPYRNEGGYKVKHWDTLEILEVGDIIFSNIGGKILSVIIVESRWKDSLNPHDKNLWQSSGREVKGKYYKLKNPIIYKNFKNFIMKNKQLNGPFDKNANPKQGYLFELSNKIGDLFFENIDSKIKKEIEEFLKIKFEKVRELEDFLLESEQCLEINTKKVKIYADDKLEELEKYGYNFFDEKSKKINSRIKTDSILKATRLSKSNYNCEFDENHKTFNRVSDKNQYMECHHLIPIKAQKDFPRKKLDCMPNLVSLCPLCHAQIHYGNTSAKKEVFDKIINIRKSELIKYGFKVSELNTIFKKYYQNT